MPEEMLTHPLFILVIGVAMVLAMLVKAGVGTDRSAGAGRFLLIGLGIRLVDDAWAYLASQRNGRSGCSVNSE